MTTADTISYMIETALRRSDDSRPRSIQKREGRLGPSDLGFCRQKALLTIQNTAPSDVKMAWWAAMIGTAVGEVAETALKVAYPTWLLGNLDGIRVSHEFPNGATLAGTPDIIVPEWNAVLDIKTKNGFEMAERNPWSTSYRFQVGTYVMGAVDAGLLDKDKPLFTGLIFLDRSGAESKPFCTPLTPFDPTVEDEITSWIDDVIYANQFGENASRDIAAPICQKICEHFTTCRGDLPMQDADQITDPELTDAIEVYVEALAMIKKAEKMKKEAREMLVGVNGTTGEHTVRWTHVNGSFVPASERRGYDKFEIVPTRRRG